MTTKNKRTKTYEYEFGLFDALLEFINNPESDIQTHLVNGDVITVETVPSWNEEYFYRMKIKEKY